MDLLVTALVLIIAVLHFYIMIMEIFLFQTERVTKMFNITKQLAQDAKVLASNQGAYNGALAMGLIVGLVVNNEGMIIYILSAIVFLSLYGGFTSGKSIILKQGLPTLITLIIYIISI